MENNDTIKDDNTLEELYHKLSLFRIATRIAKTSMRGEVGQTLTIGTKCRVYGKRANSDANGKDVYFVKYENGDAYFCKSREEAYKVLDPNFNLSTKHSQKWKYFVPYRGENILNYIYDKLRKLEEVNDETVVKYGLCLENKLFIIDSNNDKVYIIDEEMSVENILMTCKHLYSSFTQEVDEDTALATLNNISTMFKDKSTIHIAAGISMFIDKGCNAEYLLKE